VGRYHVVFNILDENLIHVDEGVGGSPPSLKISWMKFKMTNLKREQFGRMENPVFRQAFEFLWTWNNQPLGPSVIRITSYHNQCAGGKRSEREREGLPIGIRVGFLPETLNCLEGF
jgi:hypothetical protein